MRFILSILVLLGLSHAQSVTPNLGLQLPAHNASNWDTQVNYNFNILDTAFLSSSCADGTHAVGYDAPTKKMVCQLISGGGGGGGNLTGPITSVGLATTVAPTGVAAKKPIGGNSGDAIQYVSCNGNDSNDGLSWGTAKLTIYAAEVALPLGHASAPATAGSGTIFISTGQTNCYIEGGLVSSQSVNGTGIWLMNGADPNYASPPTGWLHTTGPIHFKGESSWKAPTNGQGNTAYVGAGALGSFATAGHPGVWLSGATGITFENIHFGAPSKGILIGIDSTGDRAASSVANIVFKNVAASVWDGAANWGPVVDIGGTTFWIWFENCQFTGNDAATIGTDNQAAILMDNGGGHNIVLIHVLDSEFNSGSGIKINDSGIFSQIFVHNLTIEGTGSGPPSGLPAPMPYDRQSSTM